MKKKIFVLVLLIMYFTITVIAQTDKGNWLLGGNASFSSSKQGDEKLTSINFSPNAGYFFINNLAGGISFDLSNYKVKGSDGSTTDLSIGPFLRYYFLKLAQRAMLFGEGSFGFGSYKTTGTYGSTEKFTSWMLAAGPAFFLNEHTALELALYYNSLKYKGDSDALGTIGFLVGFQIHLNCMKNKAK